VRYPHEALLFKQALQELSGFLISLLLNLAVLLFFGVRPSWMMALFPLMILPLFFLGTGLGLLLALVKVVASDLDRAFTVGLGLCLYITPVIYAPQTKSRTLQKIIEYNPLTYLIGAVRDAMIYGKVQDFDRFLICSAASILVFLFAWRIFYVSEEIIIEKMV
jgi:lipopolysaccharide transport system permease protein